ncbi:uncharacterized protein B0T15DRAFT_552707 [Chaetomium strumarium]|uniref:Secreted protein n=1 Tax=Chaetomium strumarium TaxID=1170767 RepID=A0AAJ0M2P6_9PEZI|nr:hypothetical protein B0T15DRAFT_552707 [Chaetomium strumarium]
MKISLSALSCIFYGTLSIALLSPSRIHNETVPRRRPLSVFACDERCIENYRKRLSIRDDEASTTESKLNPADWMRILEAILADRHDIMLKDLSPVQLRAFNGKIECGMQFGKRAIAKTIQGQVRTLDKRGGICHVEARTCLRLACARGGAITWCNDGDKPVARQCRDIATDAKSVMARCKHGHPKHGIIWTRGQIRDSDTTRVLVNKALC